MRLFLVCAMVCAIPFCESIDEILKYANAKAHAYLAEQGNNLKNILCLDLLHGTCYTERNKQCISVPSVRARFGDELNVPRPPSRLIESYTDTVPYGEMGFPVAKTADQQTFPRHYTAFVMDQRDTTTVAAGVTLKTVVDSCTARGAYFEALVRIMNAVESVGITAISRFCFLVVKLLKVNAKIDPHLAAFDRLLHLMQKKFDRIFISTEPICEIRAAVRVVLGFGVEASTEMKHGFFTSTCEEFSSRYRNMVDYVKLVEIPDMDNEKHAKPLKSALVSNITNAHIFFCSI